MQLVYVMEETYAENNRVHLQGLRPTVWIRCSDASEQGNMASGQGQRLGFPVV